MRNPLERIEELVLALQEKDANLVRKYLEKRDFQSVLEIAESDIYKAEKARYGRLEDVTDDYIAVLTEMRSELVIYMSYMEVPDNSDDYEDYY